MTPSAHKTFAANPHPHTPDLPTSTWEEIGFAEFPIVTTSLKRPPFDTLQFAEQVATDDQGNPIHRTWKLIGSAEYGLPRLPDFDVYIAILKLLEETGYRERTIHCTLKDICDIAGLKPGGMTYHRLKEAFTRFATTTYVAENVFRDPKTKVLVPLETWETITESRFTEDSNLLPSYFEVGKRFLSRLQNGQLKPVDLSLWRELPLGLEKPLYHYLDKNLHGGKDHHEIGLRKLSERVALTGKYSLAHLERLLSKPLTNLVNLSFLSEFTFEPSKSRHDPVKLVVFRGPRAHHNRKHDPVGLRHPSGTIRASHRGISGSTASSEAQRLVQRFNELSKGNTEAVPTSTELQRAGELLRKAGTLELALYCVEYACSQMKQTGWNNAQHFGSVLSNSYPERARAAFDRGRKEQLAQQVAAEEQNLRERYDAWRAGELDRRWRSLDQAERAHRTEEGMRQVDVRFGTSRKSLASIPSFRSSMGTRFARNNLGAGLLSFEDWKAREKTNLQAPSRP